MFMIFLCWQRCLQNMVQVRVKGDREEKSYNLEELLELQNKLMLMSSKGEHGREQVNRFMEVSDINERLRQLRCYLKLDDSVIFIYILQIYKSLLSCLHVL